jgi:hypothetical protein
VRGKVIHETIEIFLHQQKAFDQTDQNGVQYVVDWFLEKRKRGAPIETQWSSTLIQKIPVFISFISLCSNQPS